jgi:hypothetical protein
MKNICKCGNEFDVRPALVKKGYGKFCSMQCSFKWRSKGPAKRKPYNIIKENPKSFKKGQTPWNKGVQSNLIPANFKGESVGYDALHDWVNRHRGKAVKCEHCGKDHGRIEWANKSHEYKRDLSDWISLCKKCHYAYDEIRKGKSKIKEIFIESGRKRN